MNTDVENLVLEITDDTTPSTVIGTQSMRTCNQFEIVPENLSKHQIENLLIDN